MTLCRSLTASPCPNTPFTHAYETLSWVVYRIHASLCCADWSLMETRFLARSLCPSCKCSLEQRRLLNWASFSTVPGTGRKPLPVSVLVLGPSPSPTCRRSSSRETAVSEGTSAFSSRARLVLTASEGPGRPGRPQQGASSKG